MSATESDLYPTAVHEAGHAVIGRVLGMDCAHVTIEADDDSSGHVVVGDPWITLEAWWKRDRYRDISTVIVGRIITFLAGALAEIEIIGECAGGDGYDQRQAAYMLLELGRDEDDAYVRRLRRQAGNLVHRHRVTIERVAVALVARHTLAEKDIEALMRAAGLRPLAA